MTSKEIFMTAQIFNHLKIRKDMQYTIVHFYFLHKEKYVIDMAKIYIHYSL